MVVEFMGKARANLAAARICLENNLYDASANRSYYAAFQIAVAALAHRDILKDRLDHKWVQAQFNEKLIKREKAYAGKLKTYLADMQAVRNEADYKPNGVSKRLAVKQMNRAEEMIRLVTEEMNDQF